MNRSVSRKRPWLAALLAALATGFGHLYLRRWGRALAWVVLTVATTVLFVDPAAVEAAANGTVADPLAFAPTLAVAAVSVVDAYLLARVNNAVARMVAARTTEPEAGSAPVACPHCGRELDPDLEFCHWCTAELDRAADREPEGDRPPRDRSAEER
ncbi:zinc ribbon domain-containing protein [Candidatus Halobonum tyrrellensis]|uniref:DUF7575 domain-containing protein n=1 Tax=Candidatus Halobonum tyrrellensis G22 TaxID=1324957 RepID=V4HAL3_9EURY|nr:zinc ribbon domain-containing protein [Candidatus Halobonum tyrrellensis]ESP87093.1 hypothetical protein K933_16287 [Candidatus Halobonum tyrrellensis G22]